MEIETLSRLSNTNRLLVRLVLQNQLFQEKERALVLHTLSYLNLGSPSMGSPSLLTIITLRILNNKFYTECLLQHRVVLDLLLNCELELNPATVRLRPNKLGV
jgi:hypothetical protein